jgi:hypothetical protein
VRALHGILPGPALLTTERNSGVAGNLRGGVDAKGLGMLCIRLESKPRLAAGMDGRREDGSKKGLVYVLDWGREGVQIKSRSGKQRIVHHSMRLYAFHDDVTHSPALKKGIRNHCLSLSIPV